jgi:hypothetical protein
MTRHVAEGGTPYDNVGAYITKLSEESLGLTKFMRYSKSNGLMNEDTEPVIGGIRSRLNQVKESLKRMSTHRGYATVIETLGETKKELDEELVNELKDKFTVIRFDEDMESVLPYVARIVSEMNNTSRISETFSEFKEAVNTAGEIRVQMVEADHPENPANLVFDNVTKKNQHIINFMAEHILDENIQTLIKQVAIDYPRYDVPMKNESLTLVKSIMETGQTPQTAPQEPSIDEAFIDEIDEALSKYTSTDIFFETDNKTKANYQDYLNDPKTYERKDSKQQFVTKGEMKDKADKMRLAKKGGAIAGDGIGDSGKRTTQKADAINYNQMKKQVNRALTDSIGEADQTVLKLAGVYK